MDYSMAKDGQHGSCITGDISAHYSGSCAER